MKRFTKFKAQLNEDEIRKVPKDISPKLEKLLKEEFPEPVDGKKQRELKRLVRELESIANGTLYLENFLKWDSKTNKSLRESGIRLSRAATHIRHGVEHLESAEKLILQEVASGNGLRKGYFTEFVGLKSALRELQEKIDFVDRWVIGFIHSRLLSDEEKRRLGKSDGYDPPARTLDYAYDDLGPDLNRSKLRQIIVDSAEHSLKKLASKKISEGRINELISLFLGSIGHAVSAATVQTYRRNNRLERGPK